MSATELKMVKITGSSRTLGTLNGENKVISDLKELMQMMQVLVAY